MMFRFYKVESNTTLPRQKQIKTRQSKEGKREPNQNYIIQNDKRERNFFLVLFAKIVFFTSL